MARQSKKTQGRKSSRTKGSHSAPSSDRYSDAVSMFASDEGSLSGAYDPEKHSRANRKGRAVKVGKERTDRSSHVSDELKRRKSRKKWSRIVLTSLLTMVLAVGGTGAWYYMRLNSRIQTATPKTTKALAKPVAFKEPFYALILGSDTREKNGQGRSDTIMLARIDVKNKQTTLISIPRDTKVQYKGSTIKINAAYAFDGTEGAITAVSEFAGVPINHVVEVDFSGVEQIVDDLGGVTVDVPPKTHYKDVYVPEGKDVRLSGKEALTFARVRKTYATGDYQRTDNQRQLVKAITKEILNVPLTQLPAVIDSITGTVSTDMSASKVLGLAMQMRGMDVAGIYTAVVPSAPKMINGASYIVADEEAWATMMSRVDDGLSPEEPEVSDELQGETGKAVPEN